MAVFPRRYQSPPLQHLHSFAHVGKFAIRPNTRNHDTLSRDVIIKTVADAVQRLGSSHSVDLKYYDCLILVEVYRASQSPQGGS